MVRPRGVEELAADINALRTHHGEERDALTLWPERLHLARTADDRIELFIEGPLESFAQSVVGRGSRIRSL
jgi:hypothetical protein